MEQEKREILKDNLKTLYDVEIWVLGCLILAFVPVVNLVAGVVVFILGIIGIIARWNLRNIHPDYKKAVVVTALAVAANLLGGFLWAPLELLGSVFSLAQTYFTIQATNALLKEIRGWELIELGDTVWRWSIYSTIASVIVDGLGLISNASILLLPALISLIVAFAAMLYELKYLKGSSEAF